MERRGLGFEPRDAAPPARKGRRSPGNSKSVTCGHSGSGRGCQQPRLDKPVGSSSDLPSHEQESTVFFEFALRRQPGESVGY